MRNFIISLAVIAMIKNGIVQNEAYWDDKAAWTPDASYTLIDITDQPQVQIGWTYDGTNFISPQLGD